MSRWTVRRLTLTVSKPFHNGLLSSTATATTLDNVQFFWAIDKKYQEWSWNLIRIARWWLIAATVFWLCSIYTVAVRIKTEFLTNVARFAVNILIQNMYLIFSELSVLRIHVVLPKTKFVILDILLHYLPMTATLFCPQAIGWPLSCCGEVPWHFLLRSGFWNIFLAILLLFTCQTKSLFAKCHHHFPPRLSHSLVDIKTKKFLVPNSETRRRTSHLSMEFPNFQGRFQLLFLSEIHLWMEFFAFRDYKF